MEMELDVHVTQLKEFVKINFIKYLQNIIKYKIFTKS